MTHRCHALGCQVTVPPARFMCKPHWYKLRQVCRDAIWQHYRNGQETTKDPSDSYLAVSYWCIAELAHEEGKPDEEWYPLVFDAEVLREQALRAGKRDPLEGLMVDQVKVERLDMLFEALRPSRAPLEKLALNSGWSQMQFHMWAELKRWS